MATHVAQLRFTDLKLLTENRSK
jgi:hypothetical protein